MLLLLLSTSTRGMPHVSPPLLLQWYPLRGHKLVTGKAKRSHQASAEALRRTAFSMPNVMRTFPNVLAPRPTPAPSINIYCQKLSQFWEGYFLWLHFYDQKGGQFHEEMARYWGGAGDPQRQYCLKPMNGCVVSMVLSSESGPYCLTQGGFFWRKVIWCGSEI